jgi:hypothetical protein
MIRIHGGVWPNRGVGKGQQGQRDEAMELWLPSNIRGWEATIKRLT